MFLTENNSFVWEQIILLSTVLWILRKVESISERSFIIFESPFITYSKIYLCFLGDQLIMPPSSSVLEAYSLQGTRSNKVKRKFVFIISYMHNLVSAILPNFLAQVYRSIFSGNAVKSLSIFWPKYFMSISIWYAVVKNNKIYYFSFLFCNMRQVYKSFASWLSLIKPW